MSRNNQYHKDLPSSDLSVDYVHPDDDLPSSTNGIDLQHSGIDLQHSSLSNRFLNQSSVHSSYPGISEQITNIPSNSFVLQRQNNPSLMLQPSQNNSFLRNQENQFNSLPINSVPNRYQNGSTQSLPPFGHSSLFSGRLYYGWNQTAPTTQRILYDTNEYVTVSGSFEEPMDETVVQEQIIGDVMMENQSTNLREERLRLHTFFGKWPHDMPMQINPSELAQNGFYYLGPYDRVCCIFCVGILKNWDINDYVETEHRRHFPNCPFVLGHDVGNIPLGGTGKSVEVMSKSNSFGVLSTKNEPSNETPSERAENLGIVQNKPKYPQYSLEADRLATFKNWPSQIKQLPEDLAKAGLFYIGSGDKVKCFTCDGLLCQWEAEDNPWAEHARWFPDCQFVRLVKGDNYIAQALCKETPIENTENKSHSEKEHEQNSVSVQALLEDGYSMNDVSEAIKWLHDNGDVPHDKIPKAETILKVIFEKEQTSNRKVDCDYHQKQNEQIPNGKSTGDDHKEKNEDMSALLEENRELKEQKICKICLDNEISIIFLPCGHLVCCGTCASSVSECPICRGAIKGAAKAFWA